MRHLSSNMQKSGELSGSEPFEMHQILELRERLQHTEAGHGCFFPGRGLH